MKFLFSLEYPFHKFGYGGGQQIVRGLARQLVQCGHQVHVCCSGSDEMGIAVSDAPVKYHFTNQNHNRWTWLQIGMQTMRLALDLQADWVCSFTTEAMLVIPGCNLLKIPTAVYLALPVIPEISLFQGWATIKTIRYQFGAFGLFIGARVAKKVLTISDWATRQANLKWGVSVKKLMTIGTGIDPVFCEPNTLPNDRPLAFVPSFISVGRLALSQKPLDLIAEALAGLPLPWQHWTIVGSGYDEQTLRAKLKKLGLLQKTIFMGTQDSAQVATLLEKHDIVLLPSRSESFFITLYEAAAKAKVVVTNDVADVRTYFAENCSVIIAPSVSREAYIQAIVYAIENFQTLEKHAAESALRVKADYNWNTIANRFLKALA